MLRKGLDQLLLISSLASWTDLSSSGESDFFSRIISGCLSKKLLVVEVNMPDDTQTICDNAEFVGITKNARPM